MICEEEGRKARLSAQSEDSNPHDDPVGLAAWNAGWSKENEGKKQQCLREGRIARSSRVFQC